MKFKDITSIDVIGLIENASTLFRLQKYKSKKYVENYIGLGLARSGFYGTTDGENARALDRGFTTFDTSEDVILLIEGVVVLEKTPENVGSGGLAITGYGVVEVDGTIVYNGVNPSTSTLRIPSIEKATIAGTSTQGVVGLSLLIFSDDATIDGVTVPNGFSISYNANESNTVDSISYDPGAGFIILTYLT